MKKRTIKRVNTAITISSMGLGGNNATITLTDSGVRIIRGCFIGTIEQFIKQVKQTYYPLNWRAYEHKKTYKAYREEYLALAAFAKVIEKQWYKKR